jgi:hypothetical protein
MERVTGIEPAYPAWEAGVLPLNYTRRKAYVSGLAGDPAKRQPFDIRGAQFRSPPDLLFDVSDSS